MTKIAAALGESLTLDYKGKPIRALMVDGVPWFAVRDIAEALQWKLDTVKQGLEGVPAVARMTAGAEVVAPEVPEDQIFLSPVGVHYWASEVDAKLGQPITAWARRQSRDLCPTPAPGDPAMFLTIIDGEDGWKHLPPRGLRFSGWELDWEELRWSGVWADAVHYNSDRRAKEFTAAQASREERLAADGRLVGTVKCFNAQKGFGFIARNDGQPDVFVHASAVERSGLAGLKELDRVEFSLEADRRGKSSADKLELISD